MSAALGARGEPGGGGGDRRLDRVRGDAVGLLGERLAGQAAGDRVVVGGDEVPAGARPRRREADVAAGVEARGDLGRARRAELGVEDRQPRARRGPRRRAARRRRERAAEAVGQRAGGVEQRVLEPRARLGRRAPARPRPRRGTGASGDAEVGRGQLDRALEQSGAGGQPRELAAARRRARAGCRARPARARARSGPARGRSRAAASARATPARVRPGGERLAQVRRPGSDTRRPARAAS